MLTTGTLDTLLHLLSASFSAQIADDDLVWSTQASSVNTDENALCSLHRDPVFGFPQ